MKNKIMVLLITLGLSITPAFAGELHQSFDSYDATKVDKQENVDTQEKTSYENSEMREIKKKVIGLVYREVQNPA